MHTSPGPAEQGRRMMAGGLPFPPWAYRRAAPWHQQVWLQLSALSTRHWSFNATSLVGSVWESGTNPSKTIKTQLGGLRPHHRVLDPSGLKSSLILHVGCCLLDSLCRALKVSLKPFHIPQKNTVMVTSLLFSFHWSCYARANETLLEIHLNNSLKKKINPARKLLWNIYIFLEITELRDCRGHPVIHIRCPVCHLQSS